MRKPRFNHGSIARLTRDFCSVGVEMQPWRHVVVAIATS